MRILRYNIFLREDWIFITISAGSVVVFSEWICSLVAGRAEPWRAFIAIPWFLWMFGGSLLLLHTSAAIRRCKVCDVEMQRIPLEDGVGKQVVRCPKCGVEQATGMQRAGWRGRAANHKRLMGQALLDDAFGDTPSKEKETRGGRLSEEHSMDDV